MYPGMVTHSGIRGMVCDVLSSLRSPLRLPEQMSLPHLSQQKMESSLWRLLFVRTASWVRRAPGIWFKKFVKVPSPLPDPNFQASLRSTVAAALENSNDFQPLRQYYTNRVQVTYQRFPTVGELLCTKAFHFTRSSLDGISTLGLSMQILPPLRPRPHWTHSSPRTRPPCL